MATELIHPPEAEPVYVPILKGKEGEFAALEVLTTDVRRQLMPLVEIPRVPYDYANERPARSLDEHVSGIANRLSQCWRDHQLYLDLPWFEDEEHLRDGRVALAAVLADCARARLRVVPVVSRASSTSYLAAAGRHSETHRSGVCMRLLVEDFEDDVEPNGLVDRMLAGLGGTRTSMVDLLLDLEDLRPDTKRAVLIARSLFSMIPRRDEWRRIILAAASFPEDLSDVGAATISTLPRHEWELWQILQRRPGILPRPELIFGDYGISHPIPKELDPRIMLMSANIRYTASNAWLVVKGRNVRQYGFDQYFELSKLLVDREEYCGSDFSWGDRYIADCAEGVQGPGNATTWRKVGTNHHLTLVTRQLANPDLAS
jgi:hypothetical protein